MNYSSFEQGDIVACNCIFSDQIGMKSRPALIISSSAYNSKYRDLILLKVTQSKENPFPFNIDISSADLSDGKLKKESTIMVDFPLTLEKGQIMEKIGKLRQGKLQEIKQKMKELYLL